MGCLGLGCDSSIRGSEEEKRVREGTGRGGGSDRLACLLDALFSFVLARRVRSLVRERERKVCIKSGGERVEPRKEREKE